MTALNTQGQGGKVIRLQSGTGWKGYSAVSKTFLRKFTYPTFSIKQYEDHRNGNQDCLRYQKLAEGHRDHPVFEDFSTMEQFKANSLLAQENQLLFDASSTIELDTLTLTSCV